MKHLLYLLALVLPLLLAGAAVPPVPAASVAASPTVVYLVRHGEKDLTPGLADPPLTSAGEARARALAGKLAGKHPAALFTTDTRRTRATLAPLALATGLTPQVYSAKEPAALAARLGQDYPDQTVVVVGHSNTLLPLLAALGASGAPAEIPETTFDYLFRVTLRPGKPAVLKVSRYGGQ